jgi:hypothetical protein
MRTSCLAASWLVVLAAACLCSSGCDDAPNVPADVEQLAQQRERAESRAHEELAEERERLRRDAANSEPPPTDVPQDDANPPAAVSSHIDSGDEIAASSEPPEAPTPPPSKQAPAAALKWSQIRAGMTPAQVTDVLGRPTRIAFDVYLTYWYYGQGRSAGKVAFIRESQRTMAWDPPLRTEPQR